MIAVLSGRAGREVFAVPKPITSRYSQAPADLIKLGAKVVKDVSDILEELQLGAASSTEGVLGQDINLEDLEEEERKILEVLVDGNLHVDDIVRRVEMEAPRVSATLTMLEIKGLVKH